MEQEYCAYGAPDPLSGASLQPGMAWLWLSQGSLQLKLSQERLTLAPGDMVLFATLQPHEIVAQSPDAECLVFRAALPGVFDLRLPPVWREHLLCQGVIRLNSGGSTSHIRALARRWPAELRCFRGSERELVLDEMSVTLRRALLTSGHPQTRLSMVPQDRRQVRRVLNMLEYMASAYRECIGVEDVARAVGLHRATAMTQFKKVVGTSINHYLTTLRVYEARKLLASSPAPVTEIAYASGFSSLTRFYEVFARTFGEKPQRYRQACGGCV